MRLVRDIPQVEDKILSGELSLSVASQAQSFFGKQKQKSKPLSLEQKIDLLKDLENSSTRECERKLLKLDPELQRKDQDRPISESLTEIRFTADQEFMQKLEQIKNLFSNAKPNASTKEILEFCMSKLLAKSLPPAPAVKRVSIKRLVWRKSEGQCSFVGTKGRCTARKFLHIDHIKPTSKGGGHKLENLQLLCAAHNLAKADRTS